jgi:hypothetical protein
MLANVGIMDYSCLVGIEGKDLNAKEALEFTRNSGSSLFKKVS